nr:CGNR zinc finger domain-containing protein [Streptomyces tendae]
MCAGPTCRATFVDLSRNGSKQYRTRTCAARPTRGCRTDRPGSGASLVSEVVARRPCRRTSSPTAARTGTARPVPRLRPHGHDQARLQASGVSAPERRRQRREPRRGHFLERRTSPATLDDRVDVYRGVTDVVGEDDISG